MRSVIFGVASSLDNYIARADHSVDWLLWSDEVAAMSAAMWPRFDVVVMGRKTYEAALAAGMTSYPDVTNYVFSRTLDAQRYPEVEIITHDAVEYISELKQQPGKGICVMGGGELAHSLIDAGLVDEVGLNIHPIILGNGIPLFPERMREVRLELMESRVLTGGCVFVNYRVMG